MKERVMVGISGGVDSAVAALLLQRQGHEVSALFMQNWNDDAQGSASVAGGRTPVATGAQGSASVAGGRTPVATDAQGSASVAGGGTPVATGAQGSASVAEDRTPVASDAQATMSAVPDGKAAGTTGCRAEQDRRDAVAVCGRLGIPFHARNFADTYWREVFEHFLAEYRVGRTPNPDVLCNREIKFRTFLDEALALGADCIATGHYARIDERDGRWRLLRGRDAGKDQSYFLHALGQAQLARTRFPVGELPKPEVRAIAREARLPVHAKRDSTGICFVGERDFREFLGRYLPMRSGEIRSVDGACVGEHAGVFFYTLGQREGLHIGGVRGRGAAPWFVVGKDVATNVLHVDQGHDSPYLQSTRLRGSGATWIAGAAPAMEFECTARTRYRQVDEPCRVSMGTAGRVDVVFLAPQRAVTPGQSVVFYRDEECLGGAVIDSTDAPLDALGRCAA